MRSADLRRSEEEGEQIISKMQMIFFSNECFGNIGRSSRKKQRKSVPVKRIFLEKEGRVFLIDWSTILDFALCIYCCINEFVLKHNCLLSRSDQLETLE